MPDQTPQLPAGFTREDPIVMTREDGTPIAPVASHQSTSMPHPSIAAAADWLPAVGGTIGGLVGGLAGGAAGGVGAIPGGVGGAALGGATGEAWKRVINQVLGNTPPDKSVGQTAANLAGAGLEQAGAEVVGGLAGAGASKLLTSGARGAAEALMQSAVKPSVGSQSVKAVIRGKAAVPPVVKTLLDEGVNVTPGGLRKLQDLIGTTNTAIDTAIQGSKGVVYPEKVAAAADQLLARRSAQVNPKADVDAIRSALDEFTTTHGGAPNYPMTPIPVQTAQALKKGTYEALGNRAYGEVKGATTEAEKALARGLKEGIEDAAPEVQGLNAREGRLIEARDAVGRRVAMAANRDIAGIAPLGSHAVGVIGMLIDRNPMVKSLLARGLYREAAIAAGVPGKEAAIKAAVRALAVSHEPTDKDDQ